MAAGAIFLSTGCKPKVGGKCTPGAVVCTKEGALFCGDDSKYVAMGCHGPGGCTAAGTSSTCDTTLAIAGEACEVEGNIACATDKKAQLDCKNHRWVVGATCKGAKGCEFKGDELFCDHTLADNNDPCHSDGQIACTIDRSLILKCENKVFAAIDTCRGPKNCAFQELPERELVEFDCDDSHANVGDPCHSESAYACAVDKKSINVCRSNKFVLEKTCPGPKGCTVDPDGQLLHCDQAGGAAFTGSGGGGKISSAAGAEKSSAKAKPGASASAKPKSSAPASASASASAKPAASATPPASGSAKPAASAAPSAKPGASAKPGKPGKR